MDAEKASSEVARLLRMRDDAVVERIKWTNRKDTVLEGYKRRLAIYEKQGGSNSHEPSIAEAFAKHHTEYRKEEERIEVELDKANAIVKECTANFARLLVQALPVSEIKERQLMDVVRDTVKDTVKLELHKPPQVDRSAKLEKQLATLSDAHNALAAQVGSINKENEVRTKSTTSNDGTQKLEQQMATLLRAQEAQQAKVDKLLKETEELRAQNNALEAHAASLALQQKEQRLQLDAKASSDKHLESSAEHDVLALKTQLADISSRVESQQADFAKSLQEVMTKSDAALACTTPPPEIQTLEAQLKTLQELVTQHDTTLSNFEAEEHASAMSKLLAYPAWTDLNARVQGQQNELQRMSLETKGLTSAVTNVKREVVDTSERLVAVKQESNDSLVKFSDKIVQTCGGMVQGLTTQTEQLNSRIRSVETRVGAMETRTTVASRASSAVGAASPRPMHPALVTGNSPAVEIRGMSTEITTAETANQGLRSDVNALRNEINALKQRVREFHNALGMKLSALEQEGRDARETHNAHEMMIMGLDEQFKNMTTVEMAGIILDNLKKLLTNAVSLDVQHLHERLVDLESFRQEQVRKDNQNKAFVRSLTQDVKSQLSEPSAKRQRLEGVKGLDGMGAE
ncbi:unnamed protein product [Discula destructiva]